MGRKSMKGTAEDAKRTGLFLLKMAGGVPEKYRGGVPDEAYVDGFVAGLAFTRKSRKEMGAEDAAEKAGGR